ncbi:MAG: hypothetical protein AVDCRST_MAG22-896, partial [uncultured Rubrobacteraceae bacterium]
DRRTQQLRRRVRVGPVGRQFRSGRAHHDDDGVERREYLVGTGAPLDLSEPLYRLSGSGRGAGDLADVQGPLPAGELPRPAVPLVSGGLDGDPGRWMDPDHLPDDRAGGLPARPGDDRGVAGPVRAHGVRRLQGQPGSRLPVPLDKRPGRRPAQHHRDL